LRVEEANAPPGEESPDDLEGRRSQRHSRASDDKTTHFLSVNDRLFVLLDVFGDVTTEDDLILLSDELLNLLTSTFLGNFTQFV